MNTKTVTNKPAWLAWSRHAPSHRSNKTPTDHGTIDGVTSLCGIESIGGDDKAVRFDSQSAWACKRCAKVVLESPWQKRRERDYKRMHLMYATATQLEAIAGMVGDVGVADRARARADEIRRLGREIEEELDAEVVDEPPKA